MDAIQSEIIYWWLQCIIEKILEFNGPRQVIQTGYYGVDFTKTYKRKHWLVELNEQHLEGKNRLIFVIHLVILISNVKQIQNKCQKNGNYENYTVLMVLRIFVPDLCNCIIGKNEEEISSERKVEYKGIKYGYWLQIRIFDET